MNNKKVWSARAVLIAGVFLLVGTLSAQQIPPAANPPHSPGSPAATGAPAAAPIPQTAAQAQAAARKLKAADSTGDFFIISSIDTKQQQIVLKKPTEVTQLVQVNAQTQYLDENGQPLKLQNLRAGDTVFVVMLQKGAAMPIAQRIRRGPMTVDVLHQRYFSGS
jgi:hypothetical protein